MSGRRWLVIGYGSIGRRHARNLRQIGATDVRVTDASPDALAQARADGLSATPTLAEALNSRPDAAVICTPPTHHVPVALEAAMAGCHLLIEKPLAMTLDGLAPLQDAVNRGKLTVLVGCNQRFHPGPKLLETALRHKRIGRVLHARFEAGSYLPDWRPGRNFRDSYSARGAEGGGVVLDFIHEIDLATWFFGWPEEVFAMTRPGTSLGIDAEEAAELIFTYPGGMLCSMHLDYAQRWRQRACEIIGQQGTIRWDIRRHTVECLLAGQEDPSRLGYAAPYEPNTMYLEELQHFVRCLDGHEQPAADLAWAARVTELALLVKQSATARQVRRLQTESPAWR